MPARDHRFDRWFRGQLGWRITLLVARELHPDAVTGLRRRGVRSFARAIGADPAKVSQWGSQQTPVPPTRWLAVCHELRVEIGDVALVLHQDLERRARERMQGARSERDCYMCGEMWQTTAPPVIAQRCRRCGSRNVQATGIAAKTARPSGVAR